jgi:hypothetical protein
MKLTSPTEPPFGAFDVDRAQIDADVIHLRQHFENISRPATNIEDILAAPQLQMRTRHLMHTARLQK